MSQNIGKASINHDKTWFAMFYLQNKKDSADKWHFPFLKVNYLTDFSIVSLHSFINANVVFFCFISPFEVVILSFFFSLWFFWIFISCYLYNNWFCGEIRNRERFVLAFSPSDDRWKKCQLLNRLTDVWWLQVPNIVKALHKQMKEKSVKTRQCCFNMLTELVNVLPGALTQHVPVLVPGMRSIQLN